MTWRVVLEPSTKSICKLEDEPCTICMLCVLHENLVHKWIIVHFTPKTKADMDISRLAPVWLARMAYLDICVGTNEPNGWGALLVVTIVHIDDHHLHMQHVKLFIWDVYIALQMLEVVELIASLLIRTEILLTFVQVGSLYLNLRVISDCFSHNGIGGWITTRMLLCYWQGRVISIKI